MPMPNINGIQSMNIGNNGYGLSMGNIAQQAATQQGQGQQGQKGQQGQQGVKSQQQSQSQLQGK